MSDARRQRRVWYAIGAVLVIAFAAYGFTSFRSNLTPYVSFEEAMARGAKVQVAGSLVANSTRFAEATQELHFGLEEASGRRMDIHYAGIKPGNFEEATQIVAIGSYREGAFHAEQLLVKCPSKYQGLDDAPTSPASTT